MSLIIYDIYNAGLFSIIQPH